MRALVRAKAVLILHTIRLWRYRWSFLNMILAEAAWVFLFILGALLFIPKEFLGVAVKGAFWIIVAWSVISNFSGLIGGWMNFFISIGMVEEHMLRGFSPFKALIGRLIPGSAVTVASLFFMGALVGGAFRVDVFAVEDVPLLLLGMILLVVEGLSYGFTVASIAVRTSVPQNLLEILNFGFIGLMMVPLSSVPEKARLLYLAIPYIAPTHLLKVATSSAPKMLVYEAMAISSVESVIMLFLAITSMKLVNSWILRNGVRAIGFW